MTKTKAKAKTKEEVYRDAADVPVLMSPELFKFLKEVVPQLPAVTWGNMPGGAVAQVMTDLTAMRVSK